MDSGPSTLYARTDQNLRLARMRLEAGLEREAQLSLDAIHCNYRRAGKRAGMEAITQRWLA
jgi:hypothetical protein